MTRRPLSRRCRESVDLLLDGAQGMPAVGDEEAARRHVATCERCRDELTRSVLLLVSLRRLGASVRVAQPDPGSWPRLRERIAGARVRRGEATTAVGRPPRPRLADRFVGGSRLLGAAIVPLVVAMVLAPGLVASRAWDTTEPADGSTGGGTNGRLPVDLARSPAIDAVFVPAGPTPGTCGPWVADRWAISASGGRAAGDDVGADRASCLGPAPDGTPPGGPASGSPPPGPSTSATTPGAGSRVPGRD